MVNIVYLDSTSKKLSCIYKHKLH